jgi:hypothetical protein
MSPILDSIPPTGTTPSAQILDDVINTEYKHGFITDIETESAPPGLNEDIVRLISQKKEEPEFMLAWRLKAYRHWLTMAEPTWPKVRHPPIAYQNIIYYSAPKQKGDGPKVLMRLTPSFWRLMRNLGFLCANRSALPELPWTPCWTAYRSPRPSRRSLESRESSSARSVRRCGNIRN